MTLPLEFTVEGPPVSQQTRNRQGLRQWRQDVRIAAELYWLMEALPEDAPVMFTIVHVHDSLLNPKIDVDNIPKPILDALKGFVFEDDVQVTDLICRRRDLHDDLIASSASSILQEGLDRGIDFIYVLVEEAPDQEVI